MITKRGDFVRPCFDARKSETRSCPPLVPARLGKVFTVEAVTDKAVMIPGQTWLKSWVRCK